MFVRLPRFIPGLLLVTLLACATPTVVDPPGTVDWTRQFGTSSADEARGLAIDANGNLYVSGYTYGDLEGVNAGDTDTYIRAFDGNGSVRWTRQFGTATHDLGFGIAADADGNVYVAGRTLGALAAANAGSWGVFLRSYDSAGVLRWTRQFGTASYDSVFGIATDPSGHVYLAGHTSGTLAGGSAGGVDAYVRSYDGSGAVRWTRQFGTVGDDEARGVATDADGNVYVSGRTDGALEGANAGGLDGFVRSYDSAGGLRWTRQFGTVADDDARAIAADANGNVYTSGTTDGALGDPNAGDSDGFVRSYDANGVLRWTRQFGTATDDSVFWIASDASGNVYATGHTTGALEGISAGLHDAYIRSYDRGGTLRVTRQFGTGGYEVGYGVAADGSGNVFATGQTTGALGGPNAGNSDVFLRKYRP